MRILVAAVALVFGAALAQTATAQSGADLARQSVAAQGGAAALSSAKTTIIKGEAKHWEPGQSYSPTGEARFLGDSTYTQPSLGYGTYSEHLIICPSAKTPNASPPGSPDSCFPGHAREIHPRGTGRD